MTDAFKYFAFISYNSLDNQWGKRIHKRLEHYRLPSTLCSQHGWKRTPLRPIFFAPTDIQPGPLSDELKNRLKDSRHLIVVCSPNSAQSEWVGKEIEYFSSLGRTKNIHFFIVDGTPHSGDPKTECFNPIIKELKLPEILAANIHEKVYPWPWLNKERAYIQLISKLLGVEFDTLWQRHKRRLVRRTVAWAVSSIAVLCALGIVWRTSLPIEVKVRMNDISVHNDNLPALTNAVVTMQLDNETKTDTLRSLSDVLVFSNIPHRFLKKNVKFTVTCPNYFFNADTMILLSKKNSINLKRDPLYFGNIHFQLWDWHEEVPISNTLIYIEGKEIYSDSSGYVTLFIPLQEQRESYKISSSIPLAFDTITMPCFEGKVIPIK